MNTQPINRNDMSEDKEELFIDFTKGEYGIVGAITKHGEKRVAELPVGVRVGKLEAETLFDEFKKRGLCLSKSMSRKIIFNVQGGKLL